MIPTSATPRSLARGASVLAAALVALCLLWRPADSVLLVVSALAAGAVGLVCAHWLTGADRRAWTLIALGQVANGVGNVAIALDPTSWFSSADLASSAVFTLAGALTVAGMFCLICQTGSLLSSGWLVLDVLTVTGAVFVSAWAVGLQHTLDPDPTDPAVVSALGTAAVVASTLVLVVAVRIWTSREPGERVAPRLAVLAMVLSWLGDTGLAGRLPVAPSWIVLTWVASSALFLTGPVWALRATGVIRRPVDSDHALVAAVAVVGVAAPVTFVLTRGELDAIGVGVSAAVVMALVVRLVLLALRGRQLSAELAVREQHFRSMVQSAPDLMVRTDAEGRIVFVSTSVTAVFGRPPDSVVGRLVQELVVPSDEPRVRQALRALVREPRSTQRLDVRVRADGSRLLHFEALANRLDDGVVFVVRDVTERVQLQQELVDAAYRDALTGLPNRQAFDLALGQRLTSVPAAVPGQGPSPTPPDAGLVAVVFCDLDGFKSVNDTTGHATGDTLLAEAGTRVHDAVRAADLATRFGGDEFTVLLGPGTDERTAVDVARRMIEELSRPYLLDGREFVLGATAGVALAPVGTSPTDLVRDADLAMYRAKDEGGGRVRVFEPSMLVELRRRVDLEQRLHHAIVDDGLSLLYQPLVDLRSGAVSSVEALLRWTDGDRTVLGATELVALAESRGRIQAIGTWVLEQAVVQAAAWGAAGYPVGVSVNLSVTQLADESLVPMVDRILRTAGLPPERLTLEITETVLVERAGASIIALERLCGLGIHLAVDDFGTGYSALEYLRLLPVDQLKVDKAFVQGLGQLDDVTSLLRSVVGLGHDLGLSVTVEGVETAKQVRLLRQMDVQRGQGYAFARPMDAVSMLECLERGPYVVDAPAHLRRLPRVADQSWSGLTDVRQLDKPSGM